MNIFEEIKKLNLPLGKYVVMGGAAMAAHGLRETEDIDIIMMPGLLSKYKQEGWEIHPRINPDDEPGFERGFVELYPDVGSGFRTTAQELIKNAEFIDGIPFCNLEDLLKIKQLYDRDKDLRDVKLLENYLSSRSNKKHT